MFKKIFITELLWFWNVPQWNALQLECIQFEWVKKNVTFVEQKSSFYFLKCPIFFDGSNESTSVCDRIPFWKGHVHNYVRKTTSLIVYKEHLPNLHNILHDDHWTSKLPSLSHLSYVTSVLNLHHVGFVIVSRIRDWSHPVQKGYFLFSLWVLREETKKEDWTLSGFYIQLTPSSLFHHKRQKMLPVMKCWSSNTCFCILANCFIL